MAYLQFLLIFILLQAIRFKSLLLSDWSKAFYGQTHSCVNFINGLMNSFMEYSFHSSFQ